MSAHVACFNKHHFMFTRIFLWLLLWLQRVTRTLEEARFPEFYQEKITTPVRESGGGWCFSSRVICTTSLPAEHHTWWGCWEAGGHAPGPHKVFSAGGDFPHTEPGTPPKPGMDVPGVQGTRHLLRTSRYLTAWACASFLLWPDGVLNYLPFF